MSDLPDPLTPADCDLQDFAFMPLDVGRLRDSDLAADETPEACWAAVLLWAASWHQVPAASIPDNDNWIAKQAGYAQRGKIDRGWSRVRPGALRGWVKCADGRLYHPVVAEKAREAWQAKLVQRWKSECARIKKHNQRHETTIPLPDFDVWNAQGRLTGQPLPVPEDKEGEDGDNTGDNGSKGQGQGQGQGQGEKGMPPGKRSATTRGTRLPEGWVLPKPWGEWALQEQPTWSAEHVRQVADKFRDYWVGKSGKDATKVDWSATWRNWVRNEKPLPAGHVTPLNPNKQESLEQRNRQVAERLAGGGAA